MEDRAAPRRVAGADADDRVLLLHGMGCGPWVWREVGAALPRTLTPLPLVIAGHRGGSALAALADVSTSEQMVTDLERQLDVLGIRRIHVAGNSLGGWLALRLAERGRALSVLCLAPAGGWRPGSLGESLIVSRFVLGHRLAVQLNRFPRLLERPRVRRAVMGPVVRDPSRIGLVQVRTFVRDMAECQALRAAIGQVEARRLRPIVGVEVPTTIAWAREDKVLTGRWARAGFAHLTAETVELPAVGHVPMLDAPRAVAALVAESAARAAAAP